jgi:endonuclease YncB( thermonuclease family)
MLRLWEESMGFGPQIQPGLLRGGRRLVRNVVLALLALAAAFLARQMPNADLETVDGRPRLVDGDSFFIGSSEVRMQGMDAPEGRQTCRREAREWRCGEDAKRELARLIGNVPVRCDVHSKDQHGRYLATCFSKAGANLNQQMVASGMAVAFGAYEREEREARAARRGLWGSEFEKPKEWRRRNGVGS